MIFVTVGTHEQPFDRLIKKIDFLKKLGRIKDTVFIQLGYSYYKPEFCEYFQFVGFNDIMDFIQRAEIIITHGGPASIFPVLYYKKVPIVVPRQKRYREHVDDHQVYFCRRLEKDKKIVAVYDIEDLENAINNYHELVNSLIRETNLELKDKIAHFTNALDEICNELLQGTYK